MANKTPEEVASDFDTLAEENERLGKTTAASVYRDAANHVRKELVNDGD